MARLPRGLGALTAWGALETPMCRCLSPPARSDCLRQMFNLFLEFVAGRCRLRGRNCRHCAFLKQTSLLVFPRHPASRYRFTAALPACTKRRGHRGHRSAMDAERDRPRWRGLRRRQNARSRRPPGYAGSPRTAPSGRGPLFRTPMAWNRVSDRSRAICACSPATTSTRRDLRHTR